MFFEDRRGRRYPRHRIAWIGRSWPAKNLGEAERCTGHDADDYYYSVFMQDQEDALEVWSGEVAKITKGLNYVTAPPGFSLITIYELDPEPFFDTDPIIAWGIAEGFTSEPITPAGAWSGRPPHTGSCRHVILTPGGLVTCPFGEGAWDSIEAYANDQRAIEASMKKLAASEEAHR